MKIGIITFYRPMNIGAILQATATNRILFNNASWQSQLIDFRLDRTEFYRKPFNLGRILKAKGSKNKVKCFISEFVFFPKRMKTKRKLDSFVRKHLKITPNVYKKQDELLELNSVFDAFVIGSDLVWNPTMSQNFNPYFFATFADENKIIFSYAASIGESIVDEKTLRTISQNVQRFSGVSIREKTTQKQLQKISDKEIVSVLDPTLLTNREDWRFYESENVFSRKKYIFVYMLENSKTLIKSAEKLALENDLEIITFDSKHRFKSHRAKAVPTIDPGEFLSLIKNAEVILTNSLHGCAFSIVYKKDFFAFTHSTRSVRITDLLEELKLSDRMIYDENDIFLKKIDYNEVYNRLDKLREKSWDFINRALKQDD